jgi:hypothetical protein
MTLPRRRGSSFGQPRGYSSSCGPSDSPRPTFHCQRHPRSYDQSSRNTRRPCHTQLFQPSRTRPRRACQGGEHRSRQQNAVRQSSLFIRKLRYSKTSLSGLSRDQTVDAVSQAWVDGQSLRTYRHAPNTGSRKSWAAGDACSRAVNLALLVKKGQIGLPSVLTAKTWGFYEVLFKVRFLQVTALDHEPNPEPCVSSGQTF